MQSKKSNFRKTIFHYTFKARPMMLASLGIKTKTQKEREYYQQHPKETLVDMHDADFKFNRSRRIVRFDGVPKQYDPIRQLDEMTDYAQKTVKRVRRFYLCSSYEKCNLKFYYYKGLITLSNGTLAVTCDGEPYISDKIKTVVDNQYRISRNAINRLNAYLRHTTKLSLRVAVNSIECTVNDDLTYNVHAHLLMFNVKRPLFNKEKIKLNAYLIKPKEIPNDLKLKITPLKNRDTGRNVISDGHNDASNLNAVSQWTFYILKQGRMPIVKNYSGLKQIKCLYYRGKLGVMLTAILNSNSNVTLKGHAQFKSVLKNIINRYGQFSLIDAKKYDTAPKRKAISKHHYSTKENVRRFNHLNIYTGKPLKRKAIARHYSDNENLRHFNNLDIYSNDLLKRDVQHHTNVMPSVTLISPKYTVDVKTKVLAYRLSLDRRRYRKRNKYAVISTPASHDAKASDVTPFNTS